MGNGHRQSRGRVEGAALCACERRFRTLGARLPDKDGVGRKQTARLVLGRCASLFHYTGLGRRLRGRARAVDAGNLRP